MQNIYLSFKSKRLLFHIKLHPGITLTNVLKFCGMPSDTIYNPDYAPLQDNGLVTVVMTDDLKDYNIHITPKGNEYLWKNIFEIFKGIIKTVFKISCTVIATMIYADMFF